VSGFQSKENLVQAIASRLGADSPHMSTGSTEPKEIFLLVNEGLGLGLSSSLTKPEMAKAIVELAGMTWTATAESRGGTVTAEGLNQVLQAVEFFLAADPDPTSQ
jgi:hypothetical protein